MELHSNLSACESGRYSPNDTREDTRNVTIFIEDFIMLGGCYRALPKSSIIVSLSDGTDFVKRRTNKFFQIQERNLRCPATVWKGFISFGLVSIPIRLYSGARGKTVSFHLLHASKLIK